MILLISTSQRKMVRARVFELGVWIITPCSSHGGSSHHKDLSDGSWNNRRLFTRISRWHVLSSSIRWSFRMSRRVKNVPKNHDYWHSEESRPGKVPGERSGLAIPRRALGRQPEEHHQESRLCSGPRFLCGVISGLFICGDFRSSTTSRVVFSLSLMVRLRSFPTSRVLFPLFLIMSGQTVVALLLPGQSGPSRRREVR